MIGRIEETSASFEARYAPRSYPTIDNPTLANEFIFGWIASRIGVET